MSEETIIFGFDGTLMKGPPFDPSSPSLCEGEPVEGMAALIRVLFSEGYTIEICTERALTPEGRAAVIHWLNGNGFLEYIACVTPSRHIAKVYVDAAAIAFDGNVERLAERIRNFSIWTDREE